MWDMCDDVDRLHVKRNRIVGMNYLGIIDAWPLLKINCLKLIMQLISTDV